MKSCATLDMEIVAANILEKTKIIKLKRHLIFRKLPELKEKYEIFDHMKLIYSSKERLREILRFVIV